MTFLLFSRFYEKVCSKLFNKTLDKVLINNIISLFSSKVLGYLVPLLSLPYLTNTLGVKGFGYLALSAAVVQYFIIIVNYGFDLSTSQKIALNRDNKEYVSSLYFNVIFIRLIFSFFGAIVIYVVSLFIDSLDSILTLVLISYLSVFGAALYPQWLYQGKENLAVISCMKVIFQLISLPLLFFFVRDVSDIERAIFIVAIPSLLLAIYSHIYIFYKKWVFYQAPNLDLMIGEIKDGWHVFLSGLVGSLYLNSIPVFIGGMAGATSVGIYITAYKVFQASQGLYTAITSAFYPRVNTVYKNNGANAALKLIKKVLFIQSVLGGVVSVFLFLFSKEIILLLFGSEYIESAYILSIISPLPFVVGIGSVFAIQTLLVFGYKKEVSIVYTKSAFVSLLITLPSIYYFNEIGAAFAIVSVEILVSLMLFLQVVKKIRGTYYA